MILKQYYLGCLAHASYLVADEASGAAAVVDPQRDVDQYVADARQLGVSIDYVLLTHFHADFLAGHLELRDREGARVVLGARASAEYEFEALGDGDSLRLGDGVRLEVLETPGHSPESISIVVFEGGAERPHAVLSGDTLFVGDVGRPDLRASLGWDAETLARMLYDSLHGKLLRLPDDTLVYPAHGAGSLCGKALSSETVSTIGAQRRDNYALQPMTSEEFVQVVTADQPDTPDYFSYDAVLNTREHPTLEQALDQRLRPLTMGEVSELVGNGAQLLDTREAADYAAACLPGSLNIGLGGRFATWAGTLLDRDRPIVLVADPGREVEAAVRLGRIGLDGIAGYLEGGMQALGDRADLVVQAERVTAGELAAELAGDEPPLVVDVRAASEAHEGAIDGSVNVPLSRLRDTELPADRRLVVLCGSGYRSSIAASVLRASGRTDVADVIGGVGAWSVVARA